jgi:hypothetical protein
MPVNIAQAPTPPGHRLTVEDLHEPKGPLWINNQTSPVGVYTPTGKKLYVLPWKDRPAPQAKVPKPSMTVAQVFCVRGMHYKTYSGPGGPLTVFLDKSAAVPAGSSVASVDALRAAASKASRHAVAPVNDGPVPDLAALYDEDGESRGDAAVEGSEADAAGTGSDEEGAEADASTPAPGVTTPALEAEPENVKQQAKPAGPLRRIGRALSRREST